MTWPTASLLQERRRALHARIVEVLEAHHLSDQVEFLAHHAAKAEDWEKAVRYLRQAGTKALARSANREARTLFEQALAAGQQLPETPEVLAQSIDILFDLRNALVPFSEFEREREHLQEAEALAERLGDQRRLGWISAYLGNNRFWRGDPEGTVAVGHRALTIATAVDDFDLRVVANLRLGHGYHARGNYRRAIEILQQNVDMLRAARQWGQRIGGVPAVDSRCFLAWSLAEQGQLSEAMTRGQEAVEIAEAVANPVSLVHAHFAVGIASLRRGDLQRAIGAFEHSLSLCRTRDVPLFFAWAASGLGAAYTAAGRVVEGLPLLEQALDHATRTETLIYQPLRLAWLAEASLAKDRTSEALAFAARALDLASAQKEAGHEAWARRVLGEAASRGDSPEQRESRGFTTRRPWPWPPSAACARSSATVILGSANSTGGHGQAWPGARAPHDRGDDVPRDGHVLLVGAGRGGGEGDGVSSGAASSAGVDVLHACVLDHGLGMPRPTIVGGMMICGAVAVILAIGLLAAPFAAEAQQPGKVYRIGLLYIGVPNPAQAQPDTPGGRAFREGLREFGWMEGHTVTIDWRSAGGAHERLDALATELVRAGVDVIVTFGTPPTLAAKRATQTIPIVFLSVTRPVERGVVASLARPGGNVTGMAHNPQAPSKASQLLKEAAPRVSVVAVLTDPLVDLPAEGREARREATRADARKLELDVQWVEASHLAPIRRRADPDRVEPCERPHCRRHTFQERNQICAFARDHRLPTFGGVREFAVAGCLMSYAPNIVANWRRGAPYVDRILRGARPADLPVEQPTVLELVVNLGTAKTLGITIPPSLLARADEIIK